MQIVSRFTSKYICQQCGYQQTGWAGKCPECGTWGSLVETVTEEGGKGRASRTGIKGRADVGKVLTPTVLSAVPKSSTERTSTKISELDRVLGGGLVQGQVVLLAGEPGIGKSTILLQISDNLSKRGVLYASGEESLSQIKVRADRLGVKSKDIALINETNIDSIIQTAEKQLGTLEIGMLVVDSIQTMYTSDLTGMAGSVGQIRECTYRLIQFAKEKNITTFVVGHVTKEGSVAGPAVLKHLVDTVLWFEGEESLTLRVIRAVKNRFGPTDEVGVFNMMDKGLVSMSNPEKIFLSKSKGDAGSAIASILKGTRPILVEIQALVVPTKMSYPRRVAQGVDAKRLELLIAILQKRCGLPLYEYDVYVNIAGGISIKNDPSSDLAVCLAIASSFFDKPMPSKTVVVGEVGLLGDIREVVAQDKRIKEAKRLGFAITISSKSVLYLRQAIKKYIK
jgi:DNA repair protein RadA/Sms